VICDTVPFLVLFACDIVPILVLFSCDTVPILVMRVDYVCLLLVQLLVLVQVIVCAKILVWLCLLWQSSSFFLGLTWSHIC